MRKITILLFSLLAGSMLYAQPSKNDFIAGASFGFSYRDTPRLKAPEFTDGFGRNLNLTLNGEYFLTDRVSVGLSLGMAHGYDSGTVSAFQVTHFNRHYISKVEMSYGYDIYTVAGMLKYYIPITKNLYFSLGLSPGYGITRTRDYDRRQVDYLDGRGFHIYSETDVIQKGSMLFASFTPALDFFLGRRFVITASAGNIMFKHHRLADVILNDFDMNWGEFALGISFRF